VEVDCKVVQQVYEEGGWKMVLEIEVHHDSTYLSRRGLYFENKEFIEKSGKIPQDLFTALQKSLRDSKNLSQVSGIPTYTIGMDDISLITPDGVRSLVGYVESDRRAGHQ
jgi:hypothetical protein